MLPCPICGFLSSIVLLQEHVNACLDQDEPQNPERQKEPRADPRSGASMQQTFRGRSRHSKEQHEGSGSSPIVIDTSSDDEHDKASAYRKDASFVRDSAPFKQNSKAKTDNVKGHCSSDGMCMLCPLGCDQWIPVSEMDSHEILHQVMMEG